MGGDDLKLLRRQVRENSMDRGFGWINNQKDWPDVDGFGREALFCIFGTTWYWGLGLAGVKEFVARYQRTQGDYRIKVPGNVFYNGYMATRELLRTIERTGSTNILKLIKALGELAHHGHRSHAAPRRLHEPADPPAATSHLHGGLQRPATQSDDLFRILGRLPPNEVEDRASTQQCALASYAATPSYEP